VAVTFDVKRYDVQILDIEGVGWDAPRMTADDETDQLDVLLTRWAAEIPDMDPLTEGIVERIQSLARSFDRSMDETLAETQLDRRAFKLLGRLRSQGEPYRLTPGELATSMRLSSGAMTNRLDRLEDAGLIRRLPDPNDRRGTLIEPTEDGHAAWDRTIGIQARREATIASVLSDADRAALHRLLRHLMRAFPKAWGAGHDKPDEQVGSGSGD
jgi:DNA-binding MarR family transcriptional regulator